MYPRIMHIYGPFWVQSYGVMIVLGFLLFLLFTFYNKKRREIIGDDQYCLFALFQGLSVVDRFLFFMKGALLRIIG